MFTVIKYLWKYVSSSFNYEKERLKNEKEYDKQWDTLNNEIKKRKENLLGLTENVNETIKKIPENVGCFRKNGFITSIQGNVGIIDNRHNFRIDESNKTNEELRKGYQIEYLAYQIPETKNLKIISIDKIFSSHWENEIDNSNSNEQIEKHTDEISEYFDVHQRTILGTIINKYSNFITVDIDYEKKDIDTDDVLLEFVPKIGDRIYLNCKVQSDTSFVDGSGEILHVLRIYPTYLKTIKGRIDYLKSDESNHDLSYGVVNENYVFTFDILPIDYKPKEGDLVSVDIIQSDQKQFSWRCIKIIPLQNTTEALQESQNENNLFLNKNNIIVDENISFLFHNLNEVKDINFTVKNVGLEMQKICKCVFVGKKSQSQLELIQPKLNETIIINPEETYTFILRGKARIYGRSTEILAINFSGFRIGRKITIIVEPKHKNNENNSGGYNLYQNSYQINKYKAYEMWTRKQTEVIYGVSISERPQFVHKKFPNYEVPENLKRIILKSKTRKIGNEELEECYDVLRNDLEIRNYIYRFRILLQLEEIQYYISMRKYDRARAFFTREGEYLVLHVPNLAEKRPSLIIGDSVRATNPWLNNSKIQYVGVIHKILQDKILLKFNDSFHSMYGKEDYKLEFEYSRNTFRKQHYAITTGFHHLTSKILFPFKIYNSNEIQLNVNLCNNNDKLFITKTSSTKTSEEIQWFNKYLNSYQKIAIKNVLRGELRPMPYILFGPPGTGKTLTLIEMILQLTKLLPSSHLLIGTPSNSSADLIATRLINSNVLQPGDFIRLVSLNLVEKDMIPEHLKPYCGTINICGNQNNTMVVTESGLKLKCQLQHLGHHRITIGTCSTLGTLLQLDFAKGHFTHVLIDEAGQCTEPEIMCCLSQADNEKGQIVLFGDPMQLGPVILDSYAATKGLELSLLSRLLSFAPYSKDLIRFPDSFGYDPRLVTKLIFNYRSIPSILKTYNDLFYDSELLPQVKENDNNYKIEFLKSLQNIFIKSDTRSINHGVFFVGIRGENQQDDESPSWYNAAEAYSVFSFLSKLYEQNVNSKQIGIITPYQSQARFIRNIIKEANYSLPKVGSVEEFQGQERDIILISTVRSSKNQIRDDLKHSLGFVLSAKRMNVSLSRSCSLLVIFGNPYLLMLDKNWKNLIKYCVDNDAFSGCNLPNEVI